MNEPLGGHRGDISEEQYTSALEAMSANLKDGLYPVTGGAVSLMERRVVDLLYQANADQADGWAPLLPDTGNRARTLSQWYIAAIEQAFCHRNPPFDPAHADTMEGFLDDYRGIGINWTRIHTYVTRQDPTVAPMGGVYWLNGTEPTVPALCGEAMCEDIQRALPPARPLVAQHHLTPRILGTPATPLAAHAGVADRLSDIEAKHAKLQRGIWGALLGLLILVVVALGTQQRWEKVDVPRQPATFRTEQVNTGEYRVTDDDQDPCYIGQDWTDCINAHVREFNKACTGRPLDYNSHTNVCGPYDNEIRRMQQIAQPGWIVDSLGDYGHLTRTPIKKTQRVSNKDARPAITHEAVCYLGFIGECPGP